MSALNALLRVFFDAILMPFSGLPPLAGLSVVSLVISVGMLVVFKATSNQEALAAVKRRIHACLFEIRLFKDDLPAILSAQTEILGHNARYLAYSLVPMVWMMVPLLLVIAQLQFHYGYEGLRPGERTLLKVHLSEGGAPQISGGAPRKPAVDLDLPPGLRLDAPAVWIPSKREMVWRLVAEEWGDFEIGVKIAGESFGKSVLVSQEVRRISPVRYEPGFFNMLLYPAEAPLPRNGPLESISLAYPEAEISLLGYETHWMVVFFILSIVFAFMLRNRFGVTI